MVEAVYVDLEVLASVDVEDYLVRISKKDLNRLVEFNKDLVIRHWNGEQPVSLETYGADSVRTEGDTTEDNNLSNLPNLDSISEIIGK